MSKKTISSSDSDSDARNVLNTLLGKLSSRAVLLIILIALVAISAISVIAIHKGAEIDLFGVTIKPTGQDIAASSEIEEPNSGEPHSITVSINELATLSSDYYTMDMDRDAIIEQTRYLIKKTEELASYKNLFTFKLMKLELLIPTFGRYIDTRIIDENRQEAYQQIQEALKEVNAYTGTPDGEQASTYNSLVNFQKSYNLQVQDTVFKPANYGIFGYRTLEAIRSSYRLRN